MKKKTAGGAKKPKTPTVPGKTQAGRGIVVAFFVSG
jgi:hypothetical protein